MLRLMKEIQGYKIEALDGILGSAYDFFFDDRNWTLRYLVIDTGQWLPGKLVLIYTGALDLPNWAERRFPVRVTKAEIEKSPQVDEDKPISRQKEIELFQHYDWGVPYWAPAPGAFPTTVSPPLVELGESAPEEESAEGDSHLRSFREVNGYHIEAEDGKTGHVEDFIVDDEEWIVRYMVVKTRNWLPSKKVIISTEWVEDIIWNEREIRVDLTTTQLKNSPTFDPTAPVNREYERRVYDFHGRPVYWEHEPVHEHR